eukprot:g8466.t1
MKVMRRTGGERKNSRLNSLVELFEKRAMNESSKDTSSLQVSSMNLPGKLSTSKLRTLANHLSTDEECSQHSRTNSAMTSSSVNRLITSFESRKRTLESQNVLSRKQMSIAGTLTTTQVSEKYPEVAKMVQEVFNGIQEKLNEEVGTLDASFSDQDFTDSTSSVIRTVEDDEENCVSCTELDPWSDSSLGKIGALWTEEMHDTGGAAVTNLNQYRSFAIRSSVNRQFCTKISGQVLKQYTETEKLQQTSNSIKKTVDLLFANLRPEEQSDVGLVDSSVKTYRALIEMTVLKEELFSPTVNAVNRFPCVPLLEDLEVDVPVTHTQFY